MLKLITFVRYYQNEIEVPGYMLHCFLPSSQNKHRKAPQVIDESEGTSELAKSILRLLPKPISLLRGSDA